MVAVRSTCFSHRRRIMTQVTYTLVEHDGGWAY